MPLQPNRQVRERPAGIPSTEVTNELARAFNSFGGLRSGQVPTPGSQHWFFWGIVVDAGPNGEADYTDARYWVAAAYVAEGSGGGSGGHPNALLNIQGQPAGSAGGSAAYLQVVTATNVAEIMGGTHLLAHGRPVLVRGDHDSGPSGTVRFSFDSGGTGSPIFPVLLYPNAGAGINGATSYTYGVVRYAYGADGLAPQSTPGPIGVQPTDGSYLAAAQPILFAFSPAAFVIRPASFGLAMYSSVPVIGDGTVAGGYSAGSGGSGGSGSGSAGGVPDVDPYLIVIPMFETPFFRYGCSE